MSTTWQWVIFHLFLATALWFDLGVIHKKPETVTAKKALVWSAVWISLALLFGLGILLVDGQRQATLYLTGYLVEESLSVDNLFVFFVIFQYFKTPKKYEHRILFWGIIGALVMRLSFILAGVVLLERFHWMVYILGAFLVYTAVKLAFSKEAEVHPDRNLAYRMLKPWMATREWESGSFFTRRNGRVMILPAFVVLSVINVTDIMFALDSIPAVLGITTDPFIVYTSNAMAILGLRSLYSAIGKLIVTFEYLNHGLAVILGFVGFKMLASHWVEIPVHITLLVVLVVLSSTMITSWWIQKRRQHPARKH
ncbi:MAG TPA: TerC family protein [Candidatus Krumholzibacteria bacterium]